MAAELSSNWKKLQAQIKSEPSKPKAAAGKTVTGKRARGDDGGRPGKKPAPAKKPRPESQPRIRKKPPSHRRMGVTQSSQLAQEAPGGVSPSLALWAEDHDIAPEDIAEAYGLGTKTRPSAQSAAAAAAAAGQENAGRTPDLAVGKYVALDCEMVGVGAGGHDDALARVSIVDLFGRQVYDSYVRQPPGTHVVDWRTHVSGVGPWHMKQARSFDEVQAVVRDLLAGADGTVSGPRLLVGHDVRHDLRVLDLEHPPRLIRDTAKFSGFKAYGHGPKPALRVLARELLGVEIHQGAHSSVEDARVTMQLFRLHKAAFDAECAHLFGLSGSSAPASGAAASKKKPPKKKKKKKKN